MKVYPLVMWEDLLWRFVTLLILVLIVHGESGKEGGGEGVEYRKDGKGEKSEKDGKSEEVGKSRKGEGG